MQKAKEDAKVICYTFGFSLILLDEFQYVWSFSTVNPVFFLDVFHHLASIDFNKKEGNLT